jgi:hypothetical protein
MQNHLQFQMQIQKRMKSFESQLPTPKKHYKMHIKLNKCAFSKNTNLQCVLYVKT